MSGVRDCAARCLEDTLELVAFTPVGPSDQPFGWEQPGLVWAEVRLDEPRNGRLVFGANAATLAPLAADAWGGQDAGGEAGATFVTEIANLLAGQILARLHPDRVPKIGLPTSGSGPRRPRPGAIALCIDVEVGQVGLLLELDPEA